MEIGTESGEACEILSVGICSSEWQVLVVKLQNHHFDTPFFVGMRVKDCPNF